MILRTNPVVVGDGREIRVMDDLVHTAPLGIGCWDSVLDRPVRDGLIVSATPAAGGQTSVAHRSSSGIYGFSSLPTTRAAERGPVAEFPPAEPYVIEISDRLDRFVSMRVEVGVPAALPSPPPIMLFPSPNRPTPDGFAAVRASMRIEDTSVPLASGRRVRNTAHAVMSVTSDGVDHVGVIDRNGEGVVFVPFDRFAAGVPPQAQTRIATLSVRFDPALTLDTGTVPLFADIAAQPVRPHVEGPIFRPDHTFEIEFGSDVSLTSPDRSELMLQAI